MTETAPAAPSALRRLLGNMAHLLSGKAAAAIISLIYIALVTRMLGVRDFGVLNLVHSYAVFIGGLVAFSGFHALVRYGAEALANEDPRRLKQLVWMMALVELALALTAMLVAVALVNIVGQQMQWPPDALRFAPLYSLAILATVRTTPHGLLQLAERFDLIAAHQAIMPMTRLVGAVIVWFIGGGLTALLIVWLIAALCEGASMWGIAWLVWRKRWRDDANGPAWQRSIRDARTTNPGLLKFAMLSNVDLTLRDFAPRAIPLIIGAVLGPAATGLFVLAQRAAAVLYQPAQLLGQAGYPVMTKLIVAGDHRQARHLVWRSWWIATSASAAVVVVMLIAGKPLLHLMGGAAFVSAQPILILVSVGFAILAGTPTLSAAVTALGQPGRSARAQLISGLVLLPMLPLLLRMLSVNGAGWHIILQSTLLTILLVLALRASWKSP